MRLTAKILITVVSVMLVAASVLAAAPGDLTNPAQFTEKAPDTFKAKFDTSKGEFTVEVTRAWSPNGADRFYNLVKNGFYNDCRFFRLVPNFMVQFGINGNPKVSAAWSSANIKDDPVIQSNKRGYITFAKSSNPDSRTTQLFINFKDNSFLDRQGFSPFGKVVKGMGTVDAINDEYGEKPNQRNIQLEGNTYLNASFPKLDYIKTATIVE